MSTNLDEMYNEVLGSDTLNPITNLPSNSNDDISLDDLYNSTELKNLPMTGGKVPEFDYDEARENIYGSIDPFNQDLKELYAQNQGTGDKWLNATGKMAGLAGTTFAENTVGILYGLGAAVGEGKFSAFYDNEFAKTLDQFNAYLEKELPNYYSQEELDASFGEKLTTANFWADQIWKNMGFVVGAAGSGMLAAKLGASALGLKNLSTTSKAMLNASKTGQSYAGLEGAALMTELIKDAKALKELGAINTLFASTIAAKGESGIEARHMGEKLREDMLTKALEKKSKEMGMPIDKVALTQEEFDNIEKEVTAAMNVNFAANMAIVGGSNFLQFGRAFSKGFRPDKVSLGIKGTAKAPILGGPTTKIGKTLSKSKYLKNPMWEATEEQLQLASETAVSDFYLKKFDKDGEVDSGDMIDSMVKGFAKAYGTQEGLENAFSGFILGALHIPGIGGGIYGEYKLDKKKNEKAKSTIKAMEESVKNGNLDKFFRNTVRNKALENEKEQHLQNNDVFNYKNAESDQVISDISNVIDADLLDSYLDDIEALGNMSVTEFNEIFTEKNEAGEDISIFRNMSEEAKAKHIKDTANNLKEAAIKISEIKTDIEAKFLNASPVVKELLLHYAATIENVDKRINQFKSKLPTDLYSAVEQYHTEPNEENLKGFKELIKKYEDNEPQKGYKELAEDLSKLYLRRNDFATLYKQGLGNPEKLANETADKLNSLEVDKIISEAEDEATAKWWASNKDKDDHYIIEIPNTDKPSGKTKVTYKGLNGEVTTEFDSLDKEYTAKDGTTYVQGVTKVPGKGDKITKIRKDDISNIEQEDKVTPNKKITVKIENDRYFRQIDPTTGQPIGNNLFAIKDHYKNINESNTVSKEFRENEARRVQRLKAIKDLIISKRNLISTLNNKITNTHTTSLEYDIIRWLDALANEKNGKILHPYTRRWTNAIKYKNYLAGLESQLKELQDEQTQLKETKAALEADIADLIKQGILIKDAKEVGKIREEIKEWQVEANKLDGEINWLQKAIDQLKDLLKRVANILGITDAFLESDIDGGVRIPGTETWKSSWTTFNDMTDQEFYDRMEELEKRSKVSDIVQKRLNDLVKSLENVQQTRNDILREVRLLEEQVAIFEEKKKVEVGANPKKGYDNSQDNHKFHGINNPKTTHDDRPWTSAKLDIANFTSFTTGEHFPKDKLTTDPNQQRWFAVTEKLDLEEDNYQVQVVTTESAKQLFPEDEIFSEKEIEDEAKDTEPWVKLVLVDSENNPVREGGQLVFTSMRSAKITPKQVDLDNTNPDNNDIKYTNKLKKTWEDIEKRLEIYRTFRNNTIAASNEAAKKGIPITLKVTNKTTGIPILEDGEFQSVVGRIVDVGTDLNEVKIYVATSDELHLDSGKTIAVKEGGTYFETLEGNVVKANVRKLDNNEAKIIIKLLQTFVANQALGIKTPSFLYTQEGESAPVTVFEAINSILYFGKNKKAGTEASIYIQGNELVVNGKSIPLTVEALEAQLDNGELLTWLQDQYHQVNNSALAKVDEPFYQVLDVVDGKVKIKEWGSYKEYLLSDERDDSLPVGTRLATREGLQFKSVNLKIDTGIIFPKTNTAPVTKTKGLAVPDTTTTSGKFTRPPKPGSTEQTISGKPDKPTTFTRPLKPTGQDTNSNVEVPDTGTTEETITKESTTPTNQETKPVVSKRRGNALDPNKPFRKESLRESQNKEDLDKAEKWLKKILPQVKFERVKKLIDGKAMGAFRDNLIQAIKDAEQGTVAHEAFHAVFNMFLSPQEKVAIIKELESWKDYDRKIARIIKNYPELKGNKVALQEELLAEEFRNYMLTNGVYRRSIGQKIKDFFKELMEFFGFINKPGNIDQLFKNISKGKYSKLTIPVENMNTPIKYKVDGLSISQVKAVMEELTFSFIEYLYGEGGSIASLFDKKFMDINWNQIDNHLSSIIKEEAEDNPQSTWGTIANNQTIFQEILGVQFRKYIQSIGVKATEIDVDDPMLNDIIDGIEIESVKKDAQAKDSMGIVESIKFDTKDGMPNTVKLLIATLPKIDKVGNFIINPLTGGVQLLDFDKTYNFIADKLANIPTFELMMKELDKYSSDKPELLRLKHVLKADTPTGKLDLNDFLLRQAFTQQMYNTKLDHEMLLFNDEGDHYVVNSNDDTLYNTIKQTWSRNMMSIATKGSKYLSISKGKVIVDVAKLKDLYKTKVTDSRNTASWEEYLKELGITFEKSPNVTKGQKKQFKDYITSIHNTLTGNWKELEGEGVTGIFTKKAKLATALNGLSEIAAKNTLNTTELQFLGPENQTIYGITLNNGLTHWVNSLKNKLNHKYIDNIYTTGSQWKQKLIDGAINIKILTGAKIANNNLSGKDSSKLSNSDRLAIRINSILEGKYPYLRPGDKKLEYLIEAGEFIGKKGINENKHIALFQDHLVGEIIRLLSFKDGIGSNIDTYNKRGESLGIFEGMLSTSILNKLRKLESNGNYEQQARAFVKSNNAAITKDIAGYIETKIKDNKELFINSRIIDKTSSGYKNNAIVLKHLPRSEGGFNSEAQITNLIKYFTINSLLANIEQTRVFTNNVLFYKALLKRTSGLIGTKELAFNDPGTNSWIDANKLPGNNKSSKDVANGVFKSLVFDDVPVISDQYNNYHAILLKEYMKIIKDPNISEANKKQIVDSIMKPFRSIDEGDGQGWITLHELREFMQRVGGNNWSPQHEAAFEKALAVDENGKLIGAPLTAEEMFYIQPVKPQYFGPQITDSNDFFPPAFYKFSLMPLIPSMIKGTQLEKLNDHLIDTGKGMAVFGSAVKAGAVTNDSGKLESFYKEDGSINLNNIPTQELVYDFFGIQLQIAPKVKDKKTSGTQDRKLIPSNRYDNGEVVPITLFGKDEKLTTEELIEEYHTLQKETVKSSLESLINELGLSRDDNGEYIIGDITSLLNVLKDTAKTQGLIDNIQDGLESIIRDDNSTGYLDTLPNVDKIENVLTALVRNRVISQKSHGGMKVQGSSSGFDTKSRTEFFSNESNEIKAEFTKEHIAEGDTAVKWGSNELAFYGIDKTGKNPTTPMEIYLPHYFKQLIGENVDISTLDSKLLELVGYRIPTDGLHSIEYMKIKGFLPKEAGDLIILPSEIVAKAGSDYDIDKLTISLPNYTIKKGKPVYTEYLTEDNSTILERATALRKQDPDKAKAVLYRTGQDEFKEVDFIFKDIEADKTFIQNIKKENNEIIQELLTKINKLKELKAVSKKSKIKEINLEISILYSGILEVSKSTHKAKDSIDDKLSVLDILIADAFKEDNTPIHGQNTSKAIQNRLIEVNKNFLRAPENAAQLITPVSVHQLQDLSYYLEYVRRVKNPAGLYTKEFAKWKKEYKEELKQENPTNMIEFDYLHREGNFFQGGIQGVGIAALQIVHHQMAQKANLRLDNDPEIKGQLNLELAKDYDSYSLGHVNDSKGFYISDTLSAFGNAYVDIANDPFIFKINAYPNVAKTFFYLLRRGVPVDTVVFFMNQPIITEYIQRSELNNSMFLEVAGRTITKKMLGEEIADEFGGMSGDTVVFNDKQLISMLPKTGDNMSVKEKQAQVQILKDYLQYEIHAQDLSDLMQATNQDTKTPKNLGDAKFSTEQREEIMQKTPYVNANDLIDKTFLEAFKEAVESIYPMFRGLFYSEKASSEAILAPIDDVLKRVNGKDRDGYTGAYRKMKADFITYLFQTINHTSKFSESIEGVLKAESLSEKEYSLLDPNSENSIARRIADIQRDPTNPLSKNEFISSIFPMQNREDGLTNDAIKDFNKKLTVFAENAKVDHFREIFDVNPELGRDLVYAAILQSGLQNSPLTYLKNIPWEEYTEISNNIFRLLDERGTGLIKAPTDFYDMFFRNNWKDTRIVPYVKAFQTVRGGKRNRFSITGKGNIGKSSKGKIIPGSGITRYFYYSNFTQGSFNFVGIPYIKTDYPTTDIKTGEWKFFPVLMRSLGVDEMNVSKDKKYATAKFERALPLGDNIYSKQYKEILYNAIQATWPKNKEGAEQLSTIYENKETKEKYIIDTNAVPITELEYQERVGEQSNEMDLQSGELLEDYSQKTDETISSNTQEDDEVPKTEKERIELAGYISNLQLLNGGNFELTLDNWFKALSKDNPDFNKELLNIMINSLLESKFVKKDAGGLLEFVRDYGNTWFNSQGKLPSQQQVKENIKACK